MYMSMKLICSWYSHMMSTYTQPNQACTHRRFETPNYHFSVAIPIQMSSTLLCTILCPLKSDYVADYTHSQ